MDGIKNFEGILFDLDQTLVDSKKALSLRKKGNGSRYTRSSRPLRYMKGLMQHYLPCKIEISTWEL